MIDTVTTPQIEEWLKSHGATFELRKIDFSSIDVRRSLQNQARFKPLEEHLVVTYAEAMTEGAKFPPIVVTDDGRATGLLVLDGNHRVAAAGLSDKTEMSAYVATGLSPRQISVLTFDANTKHGMPTSAEERKQHAIFLIETAGISQKDAARMLNVPTSELQYALSIARTSKRLAAVGFERANSLTNWAKSRLGNISNDTVLAAAAEVVVSAKMSTEDAGAFVTEINKTATEIDALATIEAERVRLSGIIKMTVGGRAKIPESLMRLSRSLSYAERMNVEDLDPDNLDPALRASLVKRMANVVETFKAASAKLG